MSFLSDQTKTILFCIFCLSFNIKAIGNILVPFSLSDNKDQITIETQLNASKRNLLFDSGAPCCIFLKSLSDTAHYEIIRKTFIIDGYGNTAPTWITKIKEIKIGNLILKDEIFILLESNPALVKLNIEGIIGFNVINKFDWRFNFITKQVEIAKKIKQKKLDEYGVINTFIWNNCLHTILDTDSPTSVSDTCLIDFGDNMYMSSSSLFRFKEEYTHLNIHSTATAATTENDTSFILLVEKLKFNTNFCLSNFPIFTSSKLLKTAIGCHFFTMFDEIILLNSQSKMLLKNKENITVNLNKYYCFFKDNLLTSFYTKRDEMHDLKLGDNVIDKKLNTSETIDIPIRYGCQ